MSFKDGRIGVGKDPIFPLDISGSARIDGDLVLGGRFSDSQGNPILLGGGSGSTSTPQQNQDSVPSWSSSSLTTDFEGKVFIKSGNLALYTNNINTGSNAGSSNILLDLNSGSGNVANGIKWKPEYNSGGDDYSGRNFSAAILFQPEGNFFRGGIGFYTHGFASHSDDATEKMRIDMNGNVGIGTTSPETLLTVGNNAFTNGTRDLLRFASYRHNEAFTIRNNDDENTGRLEFFWGNSQNGSGGHDNTIDNSILTLRNNGNVGIGETNPTRGKLVVNGSSIVGIYSMGDYTDYNYILNAPRPGNTAGGAVHFINHASRTADGGQSCYTIRNDSGPIRLGQENQITTIEGSNVGIGTLTPSAKLDVNGSIKARGIDGGNIGSKFLVTPVTNGTHNNNNVPSITGAGNWLEYNPHVDFDFILGFTSPYQVGMQIYLKDKQGNIIQEVDLYEGSTTASSGTHDPGYEGNNVALFTYNPEKKMYEFAYATYWYNYGNNSTSKAAFNEVIDQAMPTDMIVLNGTGYCSRWMEYESETERLRTHFGSTESPYTAGWSSVQFAGIKGYGKILEFDTSGRGTERAAAVKIGDIHKFDDIDYSVAWTSDGTPNRTEAQALTSSDFCFMYNKYGGRIAKMKIHAVSDSDRTYITLADGGSGQTAFSIDNNNAFIWPSKVKQGVEQAGGTWPSGAGTYGGWITMQGGQASYYWTADDGNNYYFAFGGSGAGRRRYMVNGTRNRRDDAWPVGSTRGTNVEVRDTHLTIKKRTDGYAYGNQTRMIEFKPYMSDRWNNSGVEYQPYTVKASINSGISSMPPSLNTETGFIAFHTADNAVLDERMRIEYNGNVGIGTTSPLYPLHVDGGINGSWSARWFDFLTQISTATGTDPFTSSGGNNRRLTNQLISIHSQYAIWAATILAASDRRIKKNIVDVSDNQALEMLNNIPCRYYEYKDPVLKGEGKTIGFIAQEVREVMPMAINIEKSIIPNEMRQLDTSWNDTTLTTDLQDASGVKYKFYVSNNDDFSDEVEKEIIGNADNSFTFDQSWNNVFCYGREVDDFHTLDKQKLFALNFSATQELDRKVIALEEKIETLTKENIETLTKENQEQNVKIETLTKENYDQNVKILDLYKENNILKARLEKIQAYLGI